MIIVDMTPSFVCIMLTILYHHNNVLVNYGGDTSSVPSA